MRYFYSTLLYLCLPLVFIRLFWRARKNPAYAKRIPERFGFYKQKIIPNSIWVHAVSVGEVVAAVPMIKELRKTYPQIPVLVTNTTPTGADRVCTLLGDAVTQIYLPYDFPDAINRFFKKAQPRLGIIMETELWPSLLHLAGQNKIPMVLANARLSERSARGYLHFAKLTHDMVRHFSLVIAQTQADADRFMQLGVDAKKIKVAGSIKFDLEVPTDLFAKAKELRKMLGDDRSILIAASTHQGEDELVLQAFAEIKKVLPQALLILVPRHPERFASVAELCRKQNHKVVLRTENKSCDESVDVFMGDTMGELLLFYAVADVAYVGGSLVERGGQNPLEPAAIGVPILTGPHIFNFTLINQQLQQAGAAMQIHNPQELAEKAIDLLNNKAQRQRMSELAKAFVLKNRGALVKQLELIKEYL